MFMVRTDTLICPNGQTIDERPRLIKVRLCLGRHGSFQYRRLTSPGKKYPLKKGAKLPFVEVVANAQARSRMPLWLAFTNDLAISLSC